MRVRLRYAGIGARKYYLYDLAGERLGPDDPEWILAKEAVILTLRGGWHPQLCDAAFLALDSNLIPELDLDV